MGIEVAWIDERHEPKEMLHDKANILSGLAESRWFTLSSSTCLRFVDPYGDAVFNQAQLPILLAELRSEVVKSTDGTVRGHLEQIIALVEKGMNQAHTYIKFVGD